MYDHDNVIKEEVYFSCYGVKCHGLLYRPKNVEKAPGVVMGMGFGMVKEAHADDYGFIFAGEGIVTLAFDYRRFGKSEGEPRQALYPEDQVEDYRCAINYLKSLEFVDPNKICVWGTSFSGGHVLTLLAFPQPGIKCGVAQVPNIFSFRTALSYFGSLEPLIELVELERKGLCEGTPRYVPIVSREGPSVIATKEAIEYYLEYATKIPTFVNRVTVDSIERVLAYNPGYYVELVRKPLLVVLAKKDKTTPPDLVKEVLSKAPGEVEIREYDIGHFDVYKPPYVSEIAKLEASFMLSRTE